MPSKEIFRNFYRRKMNEATRWTEARNYCKAAGDDEKELFIRWFLVEKD